MKQQSEHQKKNLTDKKKRGRMYRKRKDMRKQREREKWPNKYITEKRRRKVRARQRKERPKGKAED